MWSLTCLALIVGLVLSYFYWVRPYLKTLPQFSEAYAKQDSFWAAVGVWLEGRKTIMVGIWGEIIAIGPDALQQISGLDLKMLMHLPDLWAAWVTAVIPILMLILRAKSKSVP